MEQGMSSGSEMNLLRSDFTWSQQLNIEDSCGIGTNKKGSLCCDTGGV
jgi:hypothetical protein